MNINTQLIVNNRPRTPMKPLYVTIHNTGNPNSTAQANRNYFANTPKAGASAHWVVDDKEAILCVPENEVAWHAGAEGNSQSIGVEVCEFTDERHEMAYQNAVKLCAEILKRHNLDATKLTTHKRWTGKNCPSKILPIWVKFVSDVGKLMSGYAVTVNGRKVAMPVKVTGGRTYVQLECEDGLRWVRLGSLSLMLGAELTWNDPVAELIIK